MDRKERTKANRNLFKQGWIVAHGDWLTITVDGVLREWDGEGVVDGLDADSVNQLLLDGNHSVRFGCTHCYIMGKGKRETAPNDKYSHAIVTVPDVGKMGIHQRTKGHQDLMRLDLIQQKRDEISSKVGTLLCAWTHDVTRSVCIGC